MVDFGPIGMTFDEMADFICQKFTTGEQSMQAALATLRKDGSPHVIPVGFWCDRAYVYLTFSPTRGAVPRIRRDPRVSISIFQHRSPAKFVTISGVAEEIPDPDYKISRSICRRYPRPDNWDVDAFEERWLEAGKVVYRVSLENWVGLDLGKVEDPVAGAQTPADKTLIVQRKS